MIPAPDRAALPVADPRRAAVAQRAELVACFERLLDSGRYALGAENDAFEREFAHFVGSTHAVGVASGTDALELALLAVGCEPGDAILAAANCGAYAAVAARRARLRVRYADVEPSTLVLSRATVAAALEADVRAVVVTHLYGLLADVGPIVALCRERGVAVVEDCAQAAGARRAGRAAGTVADVGAFSFYPTKNLGALGDGGAVITDDRAIAERVRRLRQYGWSHKYEIVEEGGRNSRLDELQAAVLRVRLPGLDAANARRREIVGRYAEALRAEAGRFIAAEGPDFVAHLAVAVLRDRERARRLLAAAGIASDVHYPLPDHRQPAWAAEYRGLELPVTEQAALEVTTVPCFPELTDDEVNRVCEVLREV